MQRPTSSRKEFSMPRKASASASPYSVHPAVAYCQAIVDNMPEKTGKSLDQWLAIVKKKKFDSEKDCREWLKKEHKLGGTTAGLIAEVWGGQGEDFLSGENYLALASEYIKDMYSTKQSLRPIHDRLIELARKLGKDVKICPCKTIVPCYRNHVFAEIKPTTKTRIDLGFALKTYSGKVPKRLLDTGGLQKGDRITHRIPLTTVDEIDDEVQKWMRIAYELDE
jgi:hypothetical protein